MIAFNRAGLILVIPIVMLNFSNCASTQNFEKSMPLTLGEVYYQDWVAGIKGGGSGVNIFIPFSENPKGIILDSVYFKGKQAKLELRNNNVFIGRFKTTVNEKQDIIMSNEPYAEYGNKLPQAPQKTPFNLEEDECIVSYSDNDKVKYFKIENIIKRESKLYQSTPIKKL